jgi:hypothetical protein
MKPKTEIRYSMPYNRMLAGFTINDLIKLKEDSKSFVKLYKKYINKILKLIEKYHSKKWKSTFIPIYIVSDKVKSSFSDPLTITYRGHDNFSLVALAHELLHNNIIKKFKNPRELHKYMEPILNKVILELPINLSKELDIFNKKTMALAIKNTK